MKIIFRHKLLLIILLATFLRLSFLGHVPPALNWDEVSMGYSAYSVLETGMDEWGEKLPLFFRSYGEWKSPLYIYLLAPFIKIFGLTPLGVRLPSAIAGVLSVYLTYLLGKKIYSHNVGLYASLFLAVSPWALMLSRPGFEANLSLTLTLVGTYFLLNHERGIKWIFASALFFGLAPHAYNSAKVVVPLLVIFLLYQTKLYKNLKSLLTLLVILFAFALPILYNLTSGVAQARLGQVGVTTDTKAIGEFYELRQSFPAGTGKLVINKLTFSMYKVANNWLSYFSPSFLLTKGGSHTEHSLPYHGVLYFSEFILIMLSLFVLKKGKSSHFLPLAFIAIGFLPAAATRDEGHVLRSILTLPGWQLLAGYGLANIARDKAKWLKLLFVAEAVIFLSAYFFLYPKVYARDWQYGHKEVAEYLALEENSYDKIVMTKWFGEPQLFLAFYNRWDPAIYQHQNIPNLRYALEGRMWLDQLPEYQMGKYTFKYLEWDKESQDSKTLYIGKFDDFGATARILKTIHRPDGSIAFIIATGTK